MELKLRNGDYVPDGTGSVIRLEGEQALLQRVLFRLKAHRGSLPARERQTAAKQYVTEALSAEPGLRVESVELSQSGDGSGELTVGLSCLDEPLTVMLELHE